MSSYWCWFSIQGILVEIIPTSISDITYFSDVGIFLTSI